MSKRVIVCPRCDSHKHHYAKGFCNSCYKRVFYPRPNQGARKKDLALRLAQLLGATKAASLIGIDVDTFKEWVTGQKKPTKEEEETIRDLLKKSRKAEKNG